MSNEKEETVKAEETVAEPAETEETEAAETAADTPEETETEPQPEPSETEVLRAEKEALAAEVNRLKNDYARAYADTENMKKRLEKDFEQRSKYRIQDFAREILPVLDNCERALAVKPKDTEDENYRKAFEMVHRQLRTALEKEGVSEIEAEGQPFDPNLHQAMMSEKAEGVEPGMVLQVLQKGYKLKDRLLRAAMVKVSE
ncbi:MAG: nucleotide exchange factor GrpE [Solobacterium sp.]|nr:nucleotide exchange factor GrpE [Solobacterium sp.]MBQ6533183.1 nucleotide exchange factor GrpE [Solobacterium sp.]